jgi:hypothetical protein
MPSTEHFQDGAFMTVQLNSQELTCIPQTNKQKQKTKKQKTKNCLLRPTFGAFWLIPDHPVVDTSLGNTRQRVTNHRITQ